MAVTVNAAVYGVAVYGVARYGKVIVSNLDQAVGTGQVSAVQVNTAAGVVGVSAIVGSIEPVSAGGFEIDVSERITTGVEGVGSAGTVQPNIAELLGSVSATTSTNTVAIRNTVTLSGVEGTGQVNTVEEKPTEVVLSVSAVGSVNTVQVNTAAGLTGVEATGSIGTLEHSNTVTPTGVQGTVSTNLVTVKILKTVGGVSASGSAGSVTEHTTAGITSAGMTGTAGQTNETAVVFNFEAVKDTYSKKRTVYISRAA